jgi:hypothetical protein
VRIVDEVSSLVAPYCVRIKVSYQGICDSQAILSPSQTINGA